nr:class I adenylate-forming enzyme family protein [Candidatus Sigynarchaeota archaeon]
MSMEEFNQMSHYLVDRISYWAKECPDDIAMIDADEGQYITWKQFENAINLRALELMTGMGFQKGDIMITMLPLLPEHIYMEYAAFKIGMIVCPLDVRLKSREVVGCVKLLHKARRILYLAPDDTDSEDKYGRAKFYAFKQIADDVRDVCPYVRDFIQLGPEEDAAKGTIGILNFLKRARRKWLEYKAIGMLEQKLVMLEQRKQSVVPDKDGAMIIFTTGSTGFPKPAVLSNAGLICQNMCMIKGFGIRKTDRLLLNLPMSHVAAQGVGLMSVIFAGGLLVLLHGFRADKSLQAIQDYKTTIFGQIPALFAMEWSLPNFKDYDLSSVRMALYGAQGMTRNQLEKFSELAPLMATGLGMTEMCGFVSYQLGDRMAIDDFVSGLGHDFPVTPVSVREPMNPDGTAGKEIPQGQTGEICYTGPQVFLGYYDNEEVTRKTISKEGILYTGDMGFVDEAGLHLAGRRKFILKPKGYQVYPAEVENYIAEKFKDRAEIVGVIGLPHEIFSEGIMAFIERKPGKTIDPVEVIEACKDLAAYKRPSHVVIMDPEQMPLNRTEKTDYMVLKKIGEKEVAQLRAKGKWDAAK